LTRGPGFVVVDGFNMGLARGTGVATYGRNLTRTLKALGHEVGVLYGAPIRPDMPPALQQALLFDAAPAHETRLRRLLRRCLAALGGRHSRAFEVTLSGTVVLDGLRDRLPDCDSVWNACNLYAKAAAQFESVRMANRVSMPRPIGVYHWTYPLPVMGTGAPNIYTLHDLVPLRLPYATLDRKAYYHRLVRWVASTADHIVTVSDASRRDIVELLGISADRVTNTYQAVTMPERAWRDEADLRERLKRVHGLEHRGYFLYFGAIEPKKNVGRMIEAYLGSRAASPLLIVGGAGWQREQELALLNLRERIANGLGPSSPQRRVVLLGHVPSESLVELISGARAVVFASLYEGFGLPVLEAMMLGTPVLTSNTSSLPEIVGDAALSVDPYDVRAIAAGFEVLDADAALRSDLTDRGMQRARLFSEDAYRQRIDAVYREVMTRWTPSARDVAARQVSDA
jgi:glycosyltransferase involved in cell wall biosynthesis